MAPRLICALLVTTALLSVPHQSGAEAGAVHWRPPVAPVRVVSAFAPPAERWLPGHRGVDLRTSSGQAVRAAGSGRVTFAGTVAGRGVVTVDHGELRTTYEPVHALVARGEAVSAGGVIGTVAPGAGHCGSGRCLHLGLRRGQEYLDPILMFGRTSAHLRPW